MIPEIKNTSGKLYRQHAGVLFCVFLAVQALHFGNRLLDAGVGGWVKSQSIGILLQIAAATIGAILLLLADLGGIKCLFGVIEDDRTDFKQFLFAFSDKQIFKRAVLLGLFVYAPIAVAESLFHSGVYLIISYLLYGASLVFLFLIPYRFIRKPTQNPISLLCISVKRMGGNFVPFLTFAFSFAFWFLAPYAAHYLLKFVWFLIYDHIYAAMAYEAVFSAFSTAAENILTAAIAPFIGLSFAFYAKKLMGDYPIPAADTDGDTRQF